MTDPTLEAIALAIEALPCACKQPPPGVIGLMICWPCSHRPAVARVIQRVIDEAHAARDYWQDQAKRAADACTLAQGELACARADSELLEKVQAKLWEVGGIDLIETDNGKIVAATGEPGPGYREAQTLREALRNLVEGGE